MSVLMDEEDTGKGLKLGSSAMGSLEEVHTQALSAFLQLWRGRMWSLENCQFVFDKGLWTHT